MNIQITARKFKAHSTLKDFITDEISSLKKFNDDIISADVILSYQNSLNSIKKAENAAKYFFAITACSSSLYMGNKRIFTRSL